MNRRCFLMCVMMSLIWVSLGTARAEEPVATESRTIVSNVGPASGSVSPGVAAWVWESLLKRGPRIIRSESLPVAWAPGLTLEWTKEIDVSGKHLGWNLALGKDGENLLVDPSVVHGPQSYQFYGWQFQPIVEGPLGLQREWRLDGGVLRVLVLDYTLDGSSLTLLRTRCEWFPEVSKK